MIKKLLLSIVLVVTGAAAGVLISTGSIRPEDWDSYISLGSWGEEP